MQPSIITTMELGSITMGENPRLPTGLKIASLMEHISVNGLLTAITVWFPENGKVAEVISGHRRLMALNMLKDKNPKLFAKLFPDGIMVIVYEDITAAEALILKLDHGGQVELNDPHELQMSATFMFNKGFTEAQVANQLKPLITKLAPMTASMKSDVKALEAAIAAAREADDQTTVVVKSKELEERIAKGYRGRVQHLHNVARCPEIVNAALFYKACDIKPEGFEDEPLPKITTDNVKALWKAHSKDLEDIDEATGAPKYSRDIVGPLFLEQWQAILKKEAEKASGTAPVAEKAMSGKAMKNEIKDGKWESVGFYKLTKHHAGDKSITGLVELDKEYKAFDLVRQYSNDLFEMVISEAEKVKAKVKSEEKSETETEG